VIRDSWRYTEREEEGELLREATDKSVVNVARYYHYETGFIRGQIDDIKSSVRGGLNIVEAVARCQICRGASSSHGFDYMHAELGGVG
jgi:hypothetical protein